MPTRAEFVAEARARIGRPYAPGGAEACGANCLGLFVGIARDLKGLDCLVAAAAPYAGHARPPRPNALLKGLREYLVKIKTHEAGPGDLLLFRVAGAPQHLALLTEPGPSTGSGQASSRACRRTTGSGPQGWIILHADARYRRVVEHRLPPGWRPVAAFRIRELS